MTLTQTMSATAAALAFTGLTFGTANAAVVDITSATFLPGTAAETDDEVVTSITAGSTFSPLQGSVAVADGEDAGDGYYYASAGTNPGSGSAAVTGLTATDGQLNTAIGSTFQFGLPLGVNDVLFVLELGTSSNTSGDGIELGLIDATGTQIGTFALTLSDTGTTNLLTTDVVRETGTGGAIANTKLFGTTFTPGDFTDSGSNAYSGINATGLILLNNNLGTGDVDIAVVGRVIPEPASLALLGLGGLMLMPRRRNR